MPGITFKGKSLVQNYHLSIPYHQLEADAARSLASQVSLEDNLIIQGDNLLALKALLPSFAGRVKCIYIDPPYNTGNEGWAYNDAVNSEMHREWLKAVVDREDLTRHDKWLCMMLPRLKLLRELLREDGVIFVSIDDNEVHHLRMLLDELFGEENFVATAIWQKVFAPKNSAQFFSEDHEYVLVYAKNSAIWRPNLLARSAEMDARYDNPDDDPRGDWTSGDLTARNYYSEGTYEVTSPAGKIFTPVTGRYWAFSFKNFQNMDADNRIWWGEGGGNMPRMKRFLSEVKQGVVPQTLWLHGDVGHTQEAKRELLSILDFESSGDVFLTPKPVRLIQRILQIGTDPQNNDIILDSFAGSGTTAQAVLAQNAEDGGNRRFILIEQEAYADSVTAERVRRVIRGVPGAKSEAMQAGLGGSFSYLRLGPALSEAAMLEGEELPEYLDMARYVFFNATGEQLDEARLDPARDYVGSTAALEVYLIYAPDVEFLKRSPLTLEWAQAHPAAPGKKRLVYAAYKYLDAELLHDWQIEFCQLPFAINRYQR